MIDVDQSSFSHLHHGERRAHVVAWRDGALRRARGGVRVPGRPRLAAAPLKRKLEAAEVVLARETGRVAELQRMLDDPGFYLVDPAIVTDAQTRHARAVKRLKEVEADWLAAAEAFQMACVPA